MTKQLYTDEQLSKYLKVIMLRQTRLFIEWDKETAICPAIARIRWLSIVDSVDTALTEVTRRAGTELLDLVSLRLNGSNCYGSWIIANYPHLWLNCTNRDEWNSQLKRGRLAWLDSLIKEFSS